MAIPRVSIERPPGQRACGGTGGNTWVFARSASGSQPFRVDLEKLKARFPSGEARAEYLEHVAEHLRWAEDGVLPWDVTVQMKVAPDVLEIRLPDWWFTGGKMHVRLYFSEPLALPGQLVALRLLVKRPGPLGLEEQDEHARSASDLLQEYRIRHFQ